MSELVSIVIPVHNAGRFISETLNSIGNQSYTDWELILVDDSSTDDGPGIMKEWASRPEYNGKVKILKSVGHQKAAGARNTGIREARGRFLTFLDADDLWLKDKLKLQLELMKEKDCAFSFTAYEFADASGNGLKKYAHVPETITYSQAVCNTTIFTSTVMYDMKKLDKDDIYMPYVESEDTASWWSVLKKVPCAYGLNVPLTLYRRSGKTLSSNKLTAIRRIWNLYRKVEHFSVAKSIGCFVQWAVRAVLRRI